MKLNRVRTFVVQTPPPYAGGALWFFVKLETDNGLVGWGETAILGTLHGLEDSYESLVQQVVEKLRQGEHDITELDGPRENISFSLPVRLRTKSDAN